MLIKYQPRHLGCLVTTYKVSPNNLLPRTIFLYLVYARFSPPLIFINPDIIIFANINRFPNIDQVRQQILPSLHVLPQQTLHLTCQENWISANYQRIFKTRIKLSCHVTLGIFSLICYGFSKPSQLFLEKHYTKNISNKV